MTPLPIFDSQFCSLLTLTLLHFLWQGVAIGFVALLGNFLFRHGSAHVRCAGNMLALAAMLTCLPITFIVLATKHDEVTVVTGLTEQPETITPWVAPVPRLPAGENVDGKPMEIAAGPISVADPSETEELRPPREQQQVAVAGTALPRWAPWATLAYGLGLMIMFARLARAHCFGARFRQDATPLAENGLLSILGREARKIGLRAVPQVAWSRRVCVPVVVGIFNPMILLPGSMMTGLSVDQVQALLSHELAHIRRHDHWLNLLQRCTEAVLFFHPAVWYVSRRVSIEREHCCDDLVLAAGWTRLNYADALLKMAELCVSPSSPALPAALAVSGGNPTLFKQRVLRVLAADANPKLRITPVGLIVATALLAGLLSTPFLLQSRATPPDTPSLIQSDPPVGTPASDKGTKATTADVQVGQREDEEVRRAIERGVEFLQRRQGGDGLWPYPSKSMSGGATALCTHALLACGTDESNEAVKLGLKQVRDMELSHTYSVALRILVLSSVDEMGDRPLVEKSLRWMAETQTAEGNAAGGWSYGPKRSRRADGSNTRFAVWALDEARRKGFTVPEELWRNVGDYWLSSQRADGSWGYQVSSMGTRTMTLSGIFCLLAVREAVADEALHGQIDKAVARAWTWHDDRFQAKDHAEAKTWRYYGLQVLASAHVKKSGLSGKRFEAAEPIRLLLDQQSMSGSWQEGSAGTPELKTSLALLALIDFLKANGSSPPKPANEGP